MNAVAAWETAGISAESGNSVIRGIRPLAMSVHCASIASALTNGGDIGAYYAPSGGSDIYLAPDTGTPIQDYTHMSSQNARSVYVGQAKEGVYGVWTPEDLEDRNFMPVSEHVLHDYPTIMVSGVVAPGSGSAGGVHAFTVYIHRVFEYTTSNAFLNVRPSLLRTSVLEEVLYLFRAGELPHVMANGRHASFIQRVLRGTLKYARDPKGLRGDIKTGVDIIQTLKQAAASVL
jgi:hypothetical protein